jgi:Arc/MetJ-type ribon-helix-helix transcriptional regulator
MMKTISLKLPLPLANWLAKRANELGRSRSDLVRQALEEQRQGKNSTGEKSCAELMAEFGGFFRGPRDLSTNPKYMRDFGK